MLAKVAEKDSKQLVAEQEEPVDIAVEQAGEVVNSHKKAAVAEQAAVESSLAAAVVVALPDADCIGKVHLYSSAKSPFAEFVAESAAAVHSLHFVTC